MLIRTLLKWLLSLGFTGALVAGAFVLAGITPQARLERVVCEGATELTERALNRRLTEILPDRMMDADPARIRRQLLREFPYKRASVERRWPSTLWIEVEERKPYAMLMDGQGRIQLIDRDGRPASQRIDQEIAIWDRPIVRGCPLTVVEGAPSGVTAARSQACARRGVGFLSWLDIKAPGWLRHVSEIRVQGEAVTLYLTDGLRVDFGAPPYGPKFARLKYAWSVAASRDIEVHGIVLGSRDQVILQTEPGEDRTPPASIRRDTGGGTPLSTKKEDFESVTAGEETGGETAQLERRSHEA